MLKVKEFYIVSVEGKLRVRMTLKLKPDNKTFRKLKSVDMRAYMDTTASPGTKMRIGKV